MLVAVLPNLHLFPNLTLSFAHYLPFQPLPQIHVILTPGWITSIDCAWLLKNPSLYDYCTSRVYIIPTPKLSPSLSWRKWENDISCPHTAEDPCNFSRFYFCSIFPPFLSGPKDGLLLFRYYLHRSGEKWSLDVDVLWEFPFSYKKFLRIPKEKQPPERSSWEIPTTFVTLLCYDLKAPGKQTSQQTVVGLSAPSV